MLCGVETILFSTQPPTQAEQLIMQALADDGQITLEEIDSQSSGLAQAFRQDIDEYNGRASERTMHLWGVLNLPEANQLLSSDARNYIQEHDNFDFMRHEFEAQCYTIPARQIIGAVVTTVGSANIIGGLGWGASRSTTIAGFVPEAIGIAPWVLVGVGVLVSVGGVMLITTAENSDDNLLADAPEFCTSPQFQGALDCYFGEDEQRGQCVLINDLADVDNL